MKKEELHKKTKEACIAAVLNFLVPGAGYIFAQKRIVFGIIMFLSMIMFSIYSSLIYDAFVHPPFSGLFFGAFLLLSVGVAYDIYEELIPKKKK